MTEKEGKGKHGKTWFAGIFALLALVVGYSIYSGVSLKKVEVPGLLVAEFGDGHENHEETAPSTTAEAPPPDRPASAPAEPELQVSASAVVNMTNPVPDITPADIGGTWGSSEGLVYTITQDGSDIILREINPMLGGMVTAEGYGEIEGRQINLNLTTPLGITGSADLALSGDGQYIRGSFSVDGSFETMPFEIFRTGR